MKNKRVLVITNSGDFDGYLISWMTQCWADLGYFIEYTSDLNTKTVADVAILHADLTDVPSCYLDLIKKYPVVINASTSSIDKKLFSSQILEQYCGYDGQVIVKTTANYGGLPEIDRSDISKIERKTIHTMMKLALSEKFNNRLLKSFIWKYVRVLDPNNYPVFNTLKDVPSGVWRNSSLIVEKFLPEKHLDGRYVLRHWYFFGNKEFNRNLLCKSPSPKWSKMDERERELSREEWWKIEITNDSKIPQEVRDVREKLNMDFGRIDWAMNNGKPVIFDANKTPGGIGARELNSDLDLKRNNLICQFSEGIKDFY